MFNLNDFWTIFGRWLSSAALYRGVQKHIILAIHIILQLTYKAVRSRLSSSYASYLKPFHLLCPCITNKTRIWTMGPWDTTVMRWWGDMLVIHISVDCSHGSQPGSWFLLPAQCFVLLVKNEHINNKKYHWLYIFFISTREIIPHLLKFSYCWSMFF